MSDLSNLSDAELRRVLYDMVGRGHVIVMLDDDGIERFILTDEGAAYVEQMMIDEARDE